jgi:transglutaminase-like putative cysteine protease
VSRLEFRAAVDAPRPPAAWVMVSVGGATLWITGQLEPWAIAVQLLAIAGSFWLRARPHPWQRSPVALNLGMLGVSGTTIAVALRGEPSTIALAHFAALTQGLQLMDARPRRSEFLLVALALFQVILAANLTDSVFFFPLLAAFVVSTTWTLMVHTLRTEALEAGMPRAIATAITPGLLRATLLASGASLLLALVLFLVLPRMQASVVRGGFGPGLSSAGFSERVELGDLGGIRADPSVVLRVQWLEGDAPPPEAAYWRGLAFDTFDGRSWSVTPPSRRPVHGSAEIGLSLGPPAGEGRLVQRVVREPVASGVLFAAGTPEALHGGLGRVWRDANGSLSAPREAEERVRYTVASEDRQPGDAELRADAARLPAREAARHLRLPALGPEIAALARRVTADAASDAERARAIESWLRRSGRYDDQPPELGPADRRSPIEVFLLGEVTGHCEYFASAMVVLARSLGLPARLVNGFAGGSHNAIGGFVELTNSDAHAWVEVHFEKAGWVRYDPTPPDLRLRAVAAGSLLDRVAELGSAVELWWFERVVDFDRSDQFGAIKSAWLAWREARSFGAASRERAKERLVDWRFDRELARRALLAAPLVGAALLLARRILRRRRRGALPETYGRALRLLARRGLERGPACTARDFVHEVRGKLPAAAPAFDAITESYLRERFGGIRRDPAHAGRDEIRQLRAALRARAS